VDAGSILGVPTVRASFLDHLSSTGAAQAESRRGADDMIGHLQAHDYSEQPPAWRVDDVEDDVDDDFDDEFGDEDEDDDDDEDDENAEDPETWQVRRGPGFTLKTVGSSLDFRSGTCLDWRPLPSSSELDPFGGLRVCLPAQSLGS
jgi:hypothetical protein